MATFHALPLLKSCMKDRWGFLFVHYKRHYCTELVSWEHAACPLSGIKKRLLVRGSLNTSSVVISIGATTSVHYREVVRSWEGLLWEVPLYHGSPTLLNSLGPKFSSQGHFHSLQLLNVPQFLFSRLVRLTTAPRGNFSHA